LLEPREKRHSGTPALKRWIEKTLELPDWSIADPAGSPIERRYRSISAVDGRFLRVVCLESPTEIRIILAFLDRGAKDHDKSGR
jgi:hypothetical protein